MYKLSKEERIDITSINSNSGDMYKITYYFKLIEIPSFTFYASDPVVGVKSLFEKLDEINIQWENTFGKK